MAFALPGKMRFLASLRNDSGGGGMALALSGTVRFLAALGMTAGENRKGRGQERKNGYGGSKKTQKYLS